MVEEDERYSTYVLVSFWKMSVFFSLFIGFNVFTKTVSEASMLFDYFGTCIRLSFFLGPNESFSSIGGGRSLAVVALL